MDDFNIEGKFPIIITPQTVLEFDEFLQKLHNYKNHLLPLLLKQGAILFRGFPIHTTEDFVNVIETLNLGQIVNYNGIFYSNDSSCSVPIPLHQERSFVKNFPHHLYFFCEAPPIEGGETLIADARRIYEELDSNVKQEFNEKGLTYIAKYFGKSKFMHWLHKKKKSYQSWIDVFETHNKEVVEVQCQADESDWRWFRQDWIEIKQTRPALLNHPDTHETIWFNQAHLYKSKSHQVTFSDGTSIPQENISHIQQVLKDNMTLFPWERGDVIVLDNRLTLHGRAPFKGQFKVLTALTKPIS